MAKILTDLTDAVSLLNSLYESDSSQPTSSEEDYLVWTALFNIAVNLWENEEGVLWKQLFVKLPDAPDGDKTTVVANHSYSCPALFQFSASGYVWLGNNANKTAYQVISQERAQLLENDGSRWCYFLMDGSPTLEFNPNLVMTAGQTINYNYYKFATKLTTGASTFEMSDPMFAVYYALSELKKDEGDTSSLQIASQKMEAMKTKNIMPTNFEYNSFNDDISTGFGV